MDQTCPNCGTTNRKTARFCQNCAYPLQSGSIPFGRLTGLLTPQSMLSNRYIILHKVGEGGMAAVYQAKDARISGKLWAIKELSAAAITNPLDRQEAVDAFRREAEVLSALTHANIPRVTDFFSESGKQYLVMDFVEGETLADILEQQNQPFTEDQVRTWAKQLCDVLDYLHSHKPPIIFRDLKPGNIMVDRAGSVKLIDFGIVRFFQPGKTKDTVSFGTAGYAPPEQYGKGQTDARSDIYALGATLHHLLTNHDPALTPFQYEPVRTFNPKVSVQMEQLIMRALKQDPAQRWQNAKEMCQAIVAPVSTQVPQSPPRSVSIPPPAPVPTALPKPTYRPPSSSSSLQRASFWGYVFTILIVSALFGGIAVLFTSIIFMPVLSQFLLVSGCLAAIITKRPGAAWLTYTLVILWPEFLMGRIMYGNYWIVGLTGLGIELVFLLGGYRRFGWWTATFATMLGAVAGAMGVGLFYSVDYWPIFWNNALGALAAGTVAFIIAKILRKS